MKRLFAIGLLALGTAVCAQTSAAKKELVAKVLQLQQPAIERSAAMMADRPAVAMMQQAGSVLQTRIPPDKRPEISKDLQADYKKYLDEAVPPMRERAVKLAPSTIGVVMEQKFTEDELKQLVAILESLESPVHRKLRQLGGEMEKALGDKLGAEMRGVIEPKLKALDQALVRHLGIVPMPAAGTASGVAKPAAGAASK